MATEIPPFAALTVYNGWSGKMCGQGKHFSIFIRFKGFAQERWAKSDLVKHFCPLDHTGASPRWAAG
jgi:hypothetical protein